MSTGVMPASAYKYQNLPNCVRSKHRTVQFTPINGSSFVNNSSNLIRIDVRSTGFLCGQESYLRFSLLQTNAALQAFSLETAGAVSCIQRLRILANGVVLSDISSYHQLATLLIQTQGSDDYQRVLSIVGGGSQTQGVNVIGDGLALLANNTLHTFSVPLISGLLNSPRYLPLGLMASGLTIEIYLEPTFLVVFNGAATQADATYTVSNVAYVAKIVELEDETAMKMIQGMMMSSGLQIKTDDWSTYQNNIPGVNAVTTSNLTIPDRSSSLKHLITTFHHSAPTHAISAMQAYKFSCTSYQYRVGSNLFPIQPVVVGARSLAEAFSELMKCFNTGLFSLNTKTSLNVLSFNNDTTVTAAGCFACSYDFENYPESEAFSGLDLSTLGLPVTFTVTLTPAVGGAGVGINVNTFSHYDVVYTLDPTGLLNRVA